MNKYSTPLVSVVIPLYNTEKWIGDTLQSVLNQSYENIEIICVDDCSTDDTLKVVEKHIAISSKIKAISLKKNSKTAAARNAGIEIATGEFILPLDGDDLIEKPYIKSAIQIFLNNPEIAVIYCNAKKFGSVDEEWNLDPYNPKEIIKKNMVHCSGLYRRTDWVKYGGYNEDLIFGREDWDFWLKFVENKRVFYRIPNYFFSYRVQEKSRSSFLNDKTKMESSLSIIHKTHIKLFWRKRVTNIIPYRIQHLIHRFSKLFNHRSL
jgi:glycosyltransferase involved in cell wall biosynthesis